MKPQRRAIPPTVAHCSLGVNAPLLMNDLITSIRSPSWWVGVFLVGILTSVVAAYAKPYLDALLGRASQAWATRTRKRTETFERRVDLAMKDDGERARLRFETIRQLSVSTFFLVFGFCTIIVGISLFTHNPRSLLLCLPGTLLILYAMVNVTSDDSYQVLLEAQRRLISDKK
jgi:hypothetical protein